MEDEQQSEGRGVVKLSHRARGVPGDRPRPATRRWLRRTAVLLASALSLVLIVAGFYAFKTYSALNDVQRVDNLMPTGTRPAEAPGAAPLNIVLMGSDSHAGQRGRSDSLMVAHLNAARSKLFLISFPRDLYVDIPAHGQNKINSAYSLGGTPLTVETLESLLGVRMQHAVEVNLDGFIDLTRYLGGVTVFNRYASSAAGDTGVTYPRGTITLEGERALAYVRQRQEIPGGDLSRGERQRAVVKAVALKLMRPAVMAKPATFIEVADRLGKCFTVDSELSNDVLWQLALALKVRGSSDIVSLQAPILGFATSSNGGAIDTVDEAQLAELAKAMREDTLEAYADRYGTSPEAAALDPETNTLYLTHPAGDTVSVLDATTHAVLKTVRVGDGPEGVSVDARSHTAYVTNAISGTVSVIDTKLATVTATVPVGSRPSAVALDEAGRTAYVANSYSSTVSVIDTRTSTVTAKMPVRHPWTLALDPAAQVLYVGHSDSGVISVIDTRTRRVTHTIPVGPAPLRLALDPTRDALYALSRRDGTVSVIDTATRTVTASVKVGTWPQSLAVDPDTHRVFVSNQLSDDVTVLDPSTATVTATVAAGERPTALVVDQRRQQVLVTHQGEDSLSVVE